MTNPKMMKQSEAVNIDRNQIRELEKLVALGESLKLEFKRKATHPDKIVRELIAFANTKGGTLLIGVDDDRTIPGIKYPEEELLEVVKALKVHCRPSLVLHETIIPISSKKFVVRLDVPPSDRQPHFFKTETGKKESYVRLEDQSIKASREMQEIMRRSRKKKDIGFSYGPHEQKLMQHLEQHATITVNQYRQLTGLNRFRAARKLILLVLANVIRITPNEKGDLYSRI